MILYVVGRSVEGVDDPFPVVLGGLLDVFLGKDPVPGEVFLDGVDQSTFALPVDLRHQVDTTLSVEERDSRW
jgi:hypothetical protein